MNAANIDYEQLIAYAAGELTPREAARVEAYLAQAPAARRSVERYRTVAALARSDESAEPPAATVGQAKALFREQQARRSQGGGWLEGLRQILAELVYDSRAQAATAGLRGTAGVVQLSYESDLADVDLEIDVDEADETRRLVRGHVSVHGDERIESIRLVRTGTTDAVTSKEPDASGMFKLVVDQGVYDLILRLDDAALVLPRIAME